MFQLRDLLNHAVKRSRVSTQLSALQLVNSANDCLSQVMGSRIRDARVVSFYKGILTIETLHASASQFIREHEDRLRTHLHRNFPDQIIGHVRYRVVHRFKTSSL